VPTKTAETIKIKKDELTRYEAIRAERLELQRRADALEKQEKSLAERLLQYVRQEGGKNLSCRIYGYVLAIVKKAGYVAWKQEYIKELGDAKAAAVVAPEREALTLTKL
jgi:hypothetical protein